jgi:Putative outer membrane beta-barrel porin, MtrB/PioB
MKTSLQTAVITLGISLVVAAVPRQARAGGQGMPGNALNPGASAPVVQADPEGIGIVEASRSPTGLLTIAPTLKGAPTTTSGGLRYRARFELGGVGLGGDENAAKFREYKDLSSGAYANTFDVMVEQPKSAFHIDAVGGGVARTDQYYGVDVGRYNTWRVRGYFSETPHVFTSTYRSLWSDVGTSALRLTGLTAGGTTNANTTQAAMLPVITSASPSDLSLTRQKSRTRLDLTLSANWKAFASYTRERREGLRPFGSVFGGGGGGGNLEVPESIDYNTQDVLAGLQLVGTQTNLTLQASASLFRNDIDTMAFENPLFITTNTIAGVAPTTFTQGQFDLYPDNSYVDIRAEIAHKLPRFFKSRVTGTVALGRSRQDDALIPWAIEPLTGGTINGVSTTGMWNTTAALSQTSADLRIGTRLADVSMLMNPSRHLTVRGKVRYYGTDNSSGFLACNPLTGQWGRLLNDGSGGSFVTPNLTAGNNPAGTLNTGYNGTQCDLDATRALGLAPSAGDVPLRSAPYEHSQMNSVLSADYRITRNSSVEAGYERENWRRPYREREKTGEDKVRLGYVNRGFSAGTLRLSYEHGRRRGSEHVAAPLADFYAESLGPVPVAAGTNMTTWVRNVDQFRRFDVADRDQNTLNVRFNHGIGSTIDVSASLQVKDLEYPTSVYGRNGTQRLISPSLELNWQTSATSNAYGFYSPQTGRHQQAGVQPNSCTMGNYYYFFSDGTTQNNATGVAPTPPAGTTLVATERVLESNWRSLCATASAASPLFPTSRTWDESQRDRNTVGGVGFRYELGRVMTEIGFVHSRGRTSVTYDYNPAAVGLNATQVALAGSGYSDLGFEENLAEASAVVPIIGPLSLRLLYRYEHAEIRDWHYDGIEQNTMPANNAAYLDFGPQKYKVHFFGVLFRYGL